MLGVAVVVIGGGGMDEDVVDAKGVVAGTSCEGKDSQDRLGTIFTPKASLAVMTGDAVALREAWSDGDNAIS